MAWVTTEDPQTFLDAAGGFLRERLASNTVPLTVAAGLAAGNPPYGVEAALFGWWQTTEGAVAGAFLHTPPFPVYLSAPPEQALGPLADLLARRGRPIGGVDGSGEQADRFAAAWAAQGACEVVPALRLRLYELTRLVPPPDPGGSATVASAPDRDLSVAWNRAFAEELGSWSTDPARGVDERLAAGAYTLWLDDAGAPVALAGVSREVAGARRLGPVFTRPDQRARGYGSAVTAAACRRALDDGASCLLLFADHDNPVSNRLYRRLGFEHLEDRRQLRFVAPG